MGHSDREPMAATALTLGRLPIKASRATFALSCLALAAWVGVGFVLAAELEGRWTFATVGVASTLGFAAFTSKSVDVIGGMLIGHANRMETITQKHSEDLRKQVLNINWLVGAMARGEARAHLDASMAFETRGPSDSGSFRIVNGTG